MRDSLLSQEEIQALIMQVKSEDVDDWSESVHFSDETEKAPAGDESLQSGSRGHLKRLSETSKVVFNNVEPKLVSRRESKIKELNHVNFNLKIVIGEAVLTVGELLGLKKDSVIVLDRLAGENARLLVNGKPLADGEVVVLNDCFAFRVNFVDDGKKEPAGKQAGGEKKSEPVLGSS